MKYFTVSCCWILASCVLNCGSLPALSAKNVVTEIQSALKDNPDASNLLKYMKMSDQELVAALPLSANTGMLIYLYFRIVILIKSLTTILLHYYFTCKVIRCLLQPISLSWRPFHKTSAILSLIRIYVTKFLYGTLCDAASAKRNSANWLAWKWPAVKRTISHRIMVIY